MTGAFFAAVPQDEQCAYCNGERRAATLAPDVQAIYCISLQEQPHRAAQAAAHLHATGLCRQVTFFRPRRGHNANYAIWESHCLVAQDAVRKGFDRVIVLEDDVFFYDAWDANVPRIKRAMDSLPAGWWGLYLGHVPIQAYFVRGGLLRTRSGCTHAYLANRPLLNWLAATPPMGSDVPTWPLIGQSIDSAVSSLPELYALFPMIARQRFLGDDRVDSRVDDRGRSRAFTDVDRWRYLFIFRGARFRSGRRRSFADPLADAGVVAPARRARPDTDRGSESLPMVDVKRGASRDHPRNSGFPSTLILWKPSRCHQ